jgi:hypothetical protein
VANRFRRGGAGPPLAPTGGMKIQRYPLVALAALLWLSWASCRGTRRRRREALSEPLPEPLQVWEGEGGENQQFAAPIAPP